MTKRIGLLVGGERRLAEQFLEQANSRDGIVAERVEVGATAERHVGRYDAIVDRISHRVPCYRAYLKAEALGGATIVNDPFWSAADDKFFALCLAGRAGVPVPRSVLLPQKAYGGAVVHHEDLANLQYPLRWDTLTDYVGLPGWLRPVRLGERPPVAVDDHHGLMAAFDEGGETVMMLQQRLDGAQAVRCLCIGDWSVALSWDAGASCYDASPATSLDEAQAAAACAVALSVGRALGYHVNAVELALYKGRFYLVDALDPMPELERAPLGEAVVGAGIEALVTCAEQAARGADRTRERYHFAASLRD